MLRTPMKKFLGPPLLLDCHYLGKSNFCTDRDYKLIYSIYYNCLIVKTKRVSIYIEHTYEWDLARKYPFIRKFFAFLDKYLKTPSIAKNSGAIVVDLDGNLIGRYYDPELQFITTGTKIKEHLYLGNLKDSFIVRLNLTQYPATVQSFTKS
ncbi:putative strictosidine synthase [Helianthus annuus]|nr:putative strictosidine synthase [Helianthus annuus]KAJ0468583.1 putative strictosidine synthase [Helianthus annuus]KAJ0659924.1 putative strictosidine synthase [Helianthus annuus]KAJ0853719.1 putative strictosidine synthase [Helianthus annuus]